MSLNASIVAYHTPQAELTRIVGLLRTSGMTKQIYIVDNSEAANPQTGQLGVEYHFMGRNAGYGTAHNVALRRSIAEHADYHLVVNSDITFEPDMLRQAVRFMDAHPDVALLSPRMIRPDGTPQSNGRLLPTPLDVFGRRFIPGWKRTGRNQRYELQPAPTGQTRNVPYLSGAFMLLRITALERVGLFDERFFMYPEDIDLTRRLHRHYQTLYLPTLNV
ncbi:MAG: glycosyltransferase, partial [Paludibacteraceae bacterium]|nr:glycosyltransferase [Paludibacteraceae bacterium]